MTLRISNNGKWLVSSSKDYSIKIWELSTRKLQHIFEAAHEGDFYFI